MKEQRTPIPLSRITKYNSPFLPDQDFKHVHKIVDYKLRTNNLPNSLGNTVNFKKRHFHQTPKSFIVKEQKFMSDI